MTMLPTPRVALAALFTLALAACEPRSVPKAAAVSPPDETPIETKVEPLRAGSYATATCFLNRPASEGIGMDIYTHAQMTFDANGIGTNHFALYDDPSCVTPLGEGTMNIVMPLCLGTVGSVRVMRMP